MTAAAVAGILYSAIVFLFGFGLGAIRVLIVAPRLGETMGVLLEAPVILAIIWVVCRRCVSRFGVAPETSPRLLMGATAFVFLQAVELGFAAFVLHRPVGEYLAGLGTSAGAIGLAAQVAFAVFPLSRRTSSKARG